MHKLNELNILNIARKIAKMRAAGRNLDVALQLERALFNGLAARGASERTIKYVLELASGSVVEH